MSRTLVSLTLCLFNSVNSEAFIILGVHDMFFFQPIPITDKYLLLMADFFFCFRKKFITCSLSTPEGKKS